MESTDGAKQGISSVSAQFLVMVEGSQDRSQ